MGHRHLYSTSQLFDSEHDQNWNHMHTDQHYVQLGRTTATETGSLTYPRENMSIDGISFTSSWNSATRSNEYASSSHNIEVPPPQSDALGSYDRFLHSSGPFFAVPDNYAHQPSSSNNDRQAFHAVDGGFIDLTMGSERGPHKRKSPGIPSVSERGSSSRYFNAGSSTHLPIPSELWQAKPNIDPQYMPLDHVTAKPNIDPQYMPLDHVTITPTFRGGGLSIRGEGSSRNVRSRSALNFESDLARTHLSSNHLLNYSTGLPIDHPSTVDISGQSSSTLTRDWSQMSISPAHGRVLLSDTSGFSHETSHLLVGSGASNASVDIGGYHHGLGTGRNPSVPQSVHGNVTQTARGVCSNYSQRSTPTFGAPSSLRLGNAAPSDDGLHMITENYSSRHQRPLTTSGWRNSDRNGRSRISTGRYRSLADEPSLQDRFSSEGFMVVDRTSLYGSRNIFDQHRDMRMDIDNMSYEDLLALGERIGHVSTGLSEDLISKCLTETIYCSSEQSQDEGTCVICLEDYKDSDDVGTLKSCGHDYHVSCIRKWLSMKNSCPICKASVVADNIK